MRISLSFLNILIICVIIGQGKLAVGQTVLKQYSGKFQNGLATYSYYETKTFDRKFHGPFQYNSGLFHMKGQHKYGLRTGLWVISAPNITFSNGLDKVIVNAMVTGNYKDGSLFGPWTFNTSMKFVQSKFADVKKSTANFIDNHFIGKFTYYANLYKNVTVNGQFDSLGIMSGKWVYKEGEISDQMVFVNGVAAWRLTRNDQTGEKLFYLDSLKFVTQFWRNYNKDTKISVINEKTYTIDTVEVDDKDRISSKLDILEISTYLDAVRGNPISLWLDTSVSLYDGSVTNPLYLVEQGVNFPKAYQIKIVPCYTDDCKKNWLNPSGPK